MPDVSAFARESSIDAASYEGVTKTSDGFLKFRSRGAYESVLAIIKDYNPDQMATWEAQLNFVSLRARHAASEAITGDANTELDDSVFSAVLNPDGVFQVGSYIFRMLYDEEYVLEVNETQKAEYFDNLLAAEFDVAAMNKFRFVEEDDAFEMLDDGGVGYETQGKTTGIFGKEVFDYSTYEYLEGDPNTPYRADVKTTWQRMVVWHVLRSKIKYQRRISGTWYGTWTNTLQIRAAGTFQLQNNPNTVYTIAPWANPIWTGTSGNNEFVRNYYYGSIRLHDFTVGSSGRFACQPHGGGSTHDVNLPVLTRW